MKTYFDKLAEKDKSRIVVITQSTHEDFSDFPILFPKITRNVKVRGDRLSLETKDLYVNLTVEFFANYSTNKALEGSKSDKYLSGSAAGLLVGTEAIEYLDGKSKALWNS